MFIVRCAKFQEGCFGYFPLLVTIIKQRNALNIYKCEADQAPLLKAADAPFFPFFLPTCTFFFGEDKLAPMMIPS